MLVPLTQTTRIITDRWGPKRVAPLAFQAKGAPGCRLITQGGVLWGSSLQCRPGAISRGMWWHTLPGRAPRRWAPLHRAFRGSRVTCRGCTCRYGPRVCQSPTLHGWGAAHFGIHAGKQDPFSSHGIQFEGLKATDLLDPWNADVTEWGVAPYDVNEVRRTAVHLA